MKRIMPWHAGEEGLTFEPKSVDEIADTLEKLWTDDDLCKTLAEKEKSVRSIFSRKDSMKISKSNCKSAKE